jgi:rSAM/selenodomain-associated transferase 2
MKFSVIVPMRNERRELPSLLSHLRALERQGCEVLIVDGESDDGSDDLARGAGFRVIASARGRARQMNTGAQFASGEVLIFIHADTRLPDGALQSIEQALQDGGRVWGRFDAEIAGTSPWFPLISALMNARSRLTGIATGDQAIFVRRTAFWAVGGYPDQPLMEDVELSRRLKRLAPPACLRARVRTSGRRWETYGTLRTVLLMWRLRFLYWLGTAPERLARAYP